MSLATMSNNILRFAPGLNLDIIKSTIQDSYRQLCSKDWNRLKLQRQIYTAAPYSTGVVFITTAGVVTGVGTSFTSAMVGQFLRSYYSDSFFEIDTYTSATSILLKDWTGVAIPVGTSCTAEADDETFTSIAHGLVNADRVYILATTLPTGLSSSIQYYVISATTNTFQVSLTSGGAAVTFSTDGTTVRWAQALAAYSIFKTIYTLDTSFKQVFDLEYQITLKKKSQSYFNKIDPARLSTGSSPVSWAYAGMASTGAIQVEIYPVPTSVIPIRVYGKTGAATLADSDSAKLPEDLVEAHALLTCYRLKDVKEPGQGWAEKMSTQAQFYAELLSTFEEEDFQLADYSNKVKDTMGEVGFPTDDNFATNHDVGW